MSDKKSCEPSLHPQRRKKMKKKQKAGSSISPKDADKPPPALSVPPVLPTISPPRPPLPKQLKSTLKKDSEKGSRKKKSPVSLFSLVSKSGVSPVQNFLSQLSGPARESVRWEGALDDPLKEEQRLEVYRANRRQRYLRHREMEQRNAEHQK